MNTSDKVILRDLTQRYLDICRKDVQQERRALWRRHNSLKRNRPLIYIRAFAFDELPQSRCVCQDPFFHDYEHSFRYLLFWDSLNDDSIFEPWITVNAIHRCAGWGVDIPRRVSDDPRGSFKIDYPIKQLEDIEKLCAPRHEIDEAATAERLARLQEAIGDLITINVDRAPSYRMWTGDISTNLGHLRGMEHIMMDMLDHPEWLHRLVAFMRDGILRTHEQAEAAGDWGLGAHQNQAMPYAGELRDPAANVNGVQRKELWAFMAAQEFTCVSPEMHNEFLLQYQLPILKAFGLVAYGCCEDLTRKIDILRQIPNLRRIAVSPFADVARCAEQIGADYILSYRPSPTDMVGYDFNPDRIRRILRHDLEACRNCHVDITLKDVETVQDDPDRVRRWVALTREVIDSVWH
ncbi:MAG: hypothetical protein KKG09_06930 [Verrucomicrobia bacterium]|nr:hypothetical protein [Verrucomicrobiota bacterium]MCG2680536.1 hypothetical protein [Kiritimatiellia bacterium]MBU4247926.1 hypothetical protein [Verrucomicrobiota bacterium]MBU4289525.1 hypothetical protein [Verrucomicrobiota bacterium]MBU4428389.1 hypothetical protein [Verrucomicrobiota bacterium]